MGFCITYIYFTTTFYQCNNGTERATISIANNYILVHWCNLCQHQSTITHYNVKCSEPYVFAPHCISNLLSLIHDTYLLWNIFIWTLKISRVNWFKQKMHEVELNLLELSWLNAEPASERQTTMIRNRSCMQKRHCLMLRYSELKLFMQPFGLDHHHHHRASSPPLIVRIHLKIARQSSWSMAE